jgi:hypothetical protein
MLDTFAAASLSSSVRHHDIMRAFTFIAFTAALFGGVSCKKATSNNLPGRYTSDRSHGFESLELKSDGTYVQVFTNSTLARTNVGQWTFKPPTLTLKSALMYDDGFNRPAATVATNDWPLKVRRLFNIWVFEDRQAQPFSEVTPENQ